MRWHRVGLAVFLAAAGTAGALVLTDTPEPATMVTVDAPAPPSTEAPALTAEEMIRRLRDNVTRQPLCEAPPEELTDVQRQILERALASISVPSIPVPPTVPSDTAGGVTNVHRRMVPC